MTTSMKSIFVHPEHRNVQSASRVVAMCCLRFVGMPANDISCARD